MSHILALDEGTSSTRALVFNRSAVVVATYQSPIACQYPKEGWVEQDPREVWRAQLNAAKYSIENAHLRAKDIQALGITNQRETTVIWDRTTGRPVGPAIVWQCRRTADICRRLTAEKHGQEVTERTGLVIDPYFSATKIAWVLDHISDGRSRAENGDLAFGTMDSWLVWNLTGGREHVIDITNASRTSLMNLSAGAWDERMLELFGVPKSMLPRIVPSCGAVGTTDGDLIGTEIPIAGIAGDQQAALFGQACFRSGLSKNTYGTGCFLLLNTGEQRPTSKNGLLATTAASQDDNARYALEGSIFVAGAVVQWLRDELKIIHSAAESETLASSVPDTAGVHLVPAFVGLGAPHWDAHARGLISGLTRGAKREHIVRAALESIAYQTRELVEAMDADAPSPMTELRADGGASANDFLMQFQADILGKPVVRPANRETTAAGAAYLAGLATGFWSGTDELERFWKADRIFEPTMPSERREELFAGWKKAVERARL